MTDLTNGTDLPTVCVLCSHNCGIRVDVKDGRIVAVRGDETNPISKGYVCNKAFSISTTSSTAIAYRIPCAARRRDVSSRSIGTPRSTEIAAKLDAIRKRTRRRRSRSSASAARATTWMRPTGSGSSARLGSRALVQRVRAGEDPAQSPRPVDVRRLAGAFLHADTEHAQFMLVLGTNPKISNRGHNATDTFKMLGRRYDATVVVADPRETRPRARRRVTCACGPGTDVYLLLAMAAVIVREGLVDDAFVAEHAIGLDLVRAELAAVDVAAWPRAAGSTSRRLLETARGFAARSRPRSSTTSASSRRRSRR
jgi:hypothetical protein